MNEVRNRASWNLGIDISGCDTIAEALKTAELDFTVDKKHLYDEYGNKIPNWFRNVRSDNNATLGVVTDKYKIVQNKDAFEFADNLVAEGVKFEKAGIFHRGTSMWLEALLPQSYNILGDDIEAHIVLKNSHSGKGSVKVAMTPLRIACSNQLSAALKAAPRTWSVVHSSKIDMRIQEARETLGLADAYMQALIADSEALAVKKMSDTEFKQIIDKIYPLEENASNRKITNVTAIKNGLLECLKADDLANFRGTAYEKFSAVTDFATHREAQRKTAEFEDARWESLIDGDAFINKFHDALVNF